MAKFKVGDRVKVVQWGWGIASADMGKETTILEEENGRYLVDVSGFDHKTYNTSTPNISDCSFELVKADTAPKFKAGDRVKIIQGGYGCHPDDTGKETTILKYLGGRSTGYLYEVDRTGLSRYTAGGGAFEQSFELAEKQVKNILNADIAKYGLHVNLNLDLAKEMVLEGKGIPAVYYMENTLILTAHHYGDGKVDLEATQAGEQLFNARQDIKMSYELDILEDMVINALQYAIQDQFKLQWPIQEGDIFVKPDGMVHTERAVLGDFAISTNLPEKEILFTPNVPTAYALKASTMENIARVTKRLQELYGQSLWKSGL